MNAQRAADIARDGDWLVAAWPSEIDATNADIVQDETLAAVDNTDAGVIVDLTRVSYIDSAGIRSLLAIRRLLSDRQQRLFAVVPNGSTLNKALDIAGVPAVIPVYQTLAAAQEGRLGPS